MKNTIFKVIIVDDEELARKMLITSTNWGALNMEIIAEAVSGQDALSIMEEQIPDFLFTDIKMPYMDGLELSRIVTKRYPHIKIVITTAFKDFDYAHQCISLGVSHFLLKPINRNDLVSTLFKLREQIEPEKQQWLEFDHLKKILKKFADNNHHLVLLTYSPDVQVVSLCEQLQHSIYQTSGNEILFGIGNHYDNFYKAETSWLEALESLKFSRYMPNQPIIIYQNDIHVQNIGWTSSPAELEDIKFYIKAGLPDSIQKVLSSLCMEPDGNLISLEHAHILSMTLLSSADNVANDIGIPLNGIFSDSGSFFLQILLEPTSQDLYNQTSAFLTRLASEIAAYRTNRSKTILWEVLQYIQSHLTDPSLSLGSIAETFHMNDSYLSRTFTKELGFSFSKYLNRLRMKHAITLLNTTDLKAYQIAEVVGLPYPIPDRKNNQNPREYRFPIRPY